MFPLNLHLIFHTRTTYFLLPVCAVHIATKNTLMTATHIDFMQNYCLLSLSECQKFDYKLQECILILIASWHLPTKIKLHVIPARSNRARFIIYVSCK